MGFRRGKRFERQFLLALDQMGQFFTDEGQIVSAVRCAYCGNQAECEEHVAPYSWIERRIRDNGADPEDLWTWILPSCDECNLIAMDKLFRSPAEKRRFIQERLRGRYSEAFSNAVWEDDEYEELGPSLRQFVMAKQAGNEVARERASYRGPLPDLLGSTNLHVAVNESLDVRLGGKKGERV